MVGASEASEASRSGLHLRRVPGHDAPPCCPTTRRKRHDPAGAQAVPLVSRASVRKERARPQLSWEFAYFSPFYARVHERFACAELQLELGRCEDALQWYASLADYTPHTLPYLAPAHLRQGEICEQLGRRADAIAHYTRFVELWEHADPELRPSLADAMARIGRLKAELRAGEALGAG